MATVTKLPLSGSTNGKNILVTGTGNDIATPIHTAASGTATWDEVYLYASNVNSASVSCSLLWGGSTEPNDLQRVVINPYSGRVLIVDGKLIQNSLVISAYTNLSSSVVVDGFVNRIT